MDVKNTLSSVELIPPADPDTTAIISQPLPMLTRIIYAIRVWAFQTFVTTGLGFLRIVHASALRKLAPTYTKRYPVRPMLESRVFIPKSYTSGTKLPLYINIHGGGFCLCDPAIDDHFCRYFADEFGYCIVSLDYRKAPSYPFPTPVNDCAELARAVLLDKDLPVDHEKVVLGGFSAGGNLSLAIAQYDDLKNKIKAVVPFYPAVDFTQKAREYRKTKDGKEDLLKSSSKLFNWAYVPQETDRKNPLLSCVYATREMLPQKMYFVGAEYDCLCNEAKVLARRLAGIEKEPDLGATWNKNGIRWEMVQDRQHGFTHVTSKGDEEVERKQFCNDLYQRIDAWIKEEVFKK